MNDTTDELRRNIPIVVDGLISYLENSIPNKTVLKQESPSVIANELELEKWIKQGGLSTDHLSPFLHKYLANSQHMHHPHYIGHQVATPHLANGVADFVHGVINNPMAIYEMGPSAATIEQTLINWMLDKAGWFKGDSWTDYRNIPHNGAGIMTHGGSLANLTVMLSARARIAPDAWDNGNPSDLVVIGTDVAHYSVVRALSMMGLGSKSFVGVSSTDMEVLQPDELYKTYQQVKQESKRVMAVVANACATSTGLYDPLEEMGIFCQENNLWFHVDGAHGASALLSADIKHYLNGLQYADSMIWDAHKMLRTSGLCAAVLFRDKQDMLNTFQQKGSYLFHEKDHIGFDFMPYQVECTKAAIATKLFWVLASEGEEGLGQYVAAQYHKAHEFYDYINNQDDFQCPYTPEANILCFKYIGNDLTNEYQLKLRNEIVKRGNFYITSTEVKGTRYLRLTIINPKTQLEHITALLDEIVQVASSNSMQNFYLH